MASTLAAFVLAVALVHLEDVRLSPTWPWMALPLFVATLALCVQPVAGLALVVGASAAGGHHAGYWAAPIVTVALPTLVMHAIRTGSWRLPFTWAAAGLALTLACEGLYFDHRAVSAIGGHTLYPRPGLALGVRLTAEAAILIATRYLLFGRTWALFALVIACATLGLSPAPGYAYWQFASSCMGPWFRHPLDGGAEDFGCIAFLLALTWSVPIARWLRADGQTRA